MPINVRRAPAIVLVLAFTALLAGCSDDDDDDGGTDPEELGNIAGRVTSGGTGVPDVSITLSGEGTGTATTGADGRYRFDDRDVGSYTVTIAVPDGFDLAAGQTIAKPATVTDGGTATVDWILEEQTTTGAIAGHVLAGAAPVAGAAIALTGTATGNTTTAADGSYRFDGLAAGPYTATLTVPDGFALAAGQTAAKNTTVAVGATATVDWSLEDTGGGNVVTVQVAGTEFDPDAVTVAPGTTVRWVVVNGSHTITPEDPQQEGAWNGVSVIGGQQFEHTFDVAGTYEYVCLIHESLGMTGTITVQ